MCRLGKQKSNFIALHVHYTCRCSPPKPPIINVCSSLDFSRLSYLPVPTVLPCDWFTRVNLSSVTSTSASAVFSLPPPRWWIHRFHVVLFRVDGPNITDLHKVSELLYDYSIMPARRWVKLFIFFIVFRKSSRCLFLVVKFCIISSGYKRKRR